MKGWSTFWTIVVNGAAWGILQPGIAYLCTQIPVSAFSASTWLFRPRTWERDGDIYQRAFRVRRWKGWLPSGGAVFEGGFSMRRIASSDTVYLHRWVRETCRAELTHWVAVLVSALFFLWNRPLVAMLMVVYALAANLPCIIAQRYNRPRLLRVLRHAAKSETQP